MKDIAGWSAFGKTIESGERMGWNAGRKKDPP